MEERENNEYDDIEGDVEILEDDEQNDLTMKGVDGGDSEAESRSLVEGVYNAEESEK